MLLSSSLKLTRSLLRMMGIAKSKPKAPYPFLEDQDSIDAVRDSKVLFVLRGLPGSGKSTLAKAISEKYQPQSVVISADRHQISPLGSPTEGDDEPYAKLDEEIQQQLKGQRSIVVVDDTHHLKSRLDYLFESVKEFRCVIVVVEPRNAWIDDCSVLAQKSHWQPSEKELESMKENLNQLLIPYFFGWFLTKTSAKKMTEAGEQFLNNLTEQEKFLEEFVQHTTSKTKDNFNLQEYFQKKPSMLHCTTKFCDFGAEPNCKKYMKTQAVVQDLSKAFDLKITQLFITPRTVGARVKLTPDQLRLWPSDESESDETRRGSQSHITLACAPQVKAVQTGLDLLQLEWLQANQTPEQQLKLGKGELACYGEGRWILSLSEDTKVRTIFSGFYPRKNPTERAGV